MTDQEKKNKAQMTESIIKELSRTHPTVHVTSKYPVRKKNERGEVFETLWGKEGEKTVLILQKRDFSLKVTDDVDQYKSAK